jgi:hypothetical protein
LEYLWDCRGSRIEALESEDSGLAKQESRREERGEMRWEKREGADGRERKGERVKEMKENG